VLLPCLARARLLPLEPVPRQVSQQQADKAHLLLPLPDQLQAWQRQLGRALAAALLLELDRLLAQQQPQQTA
jgi:hypothetical protein